MGFCVLYYQTIIFTGVYQRWAMYALKPKSVLEMHFRANSKKTQSLGTNGGGLQFFIKNKLKSEIFNDKKLYEQKCFSLSQLRI